MRSSLDRRKDRHHPCNGECCGCQKSFHVISPLPGESICTYMNEDPLISSAKMSIGLGCLDNLELNGASIVNAKLSNQERSSFRAQRSNLVDVAFSRSGLLRRY